jgi:hypothetical protein
MPFAKRRPGLHHLLLAGGFAAAIGACSDTYYDRRDAINLSLGDANASNIAAQTVDPWPRHAADRNIPTNGQVVEAAMKRYREGKVIPPRGLGTSSVEISPSSANAPAASQ